MGSRLDLSLDEIISREQTQSTGERQTPARACTHMHAPRSSATRLGPAATREATWLCVLPSCALRERPPRA